MITQHRSAKAKFRRGFNLVEAAIVLGVVGLVIGGIWTAASTVNENMKWQQTSTGWLYYREIITKNFNASTMGSSGAGTLLDTSLIKFPLPAGWSIGGPYGVNPVDPFGNPLFSQYHVGNFFMGYQNTLSPSLCIKVQRLIWGTLNKTNPIYYTNSPPACATNINACCPGGAGNDTAAYFSY